MTEIQWIIHLMVNHPLEESVKKLCLERIGDVEKNLTERKITYKEVITPPNAQWGSPLAPIPTVPMPTQGPPLSAAQARDMAINVPIAGALASPMPLAPRPTTEIVTGVGNGTQIRGKRKF